MRCLYAKILYAHEQIFLFKVPPNAVVESMIPTFQQPIPTTNNHVSNGASVVNNNSNSVASTGYTSIIGTTNTLDTPSSVNSSVSSTAYAPTPTPAAKARSVENAHSSTSNITVAAKATATYNILGNEAELIFNELNGHNASCRSSYNNIPFKKRKLYDYGKINSKNLKLSMCCGKIADFVYSINALNTLILSNTISLKHLPWIMEAGIKLMEKMHSIIHRDDNDAEYPLTKECLAFLIFIRNYCSTSTFNREDALYLIAQQNFLFLIFKNMKF